MLLVHGFTGSPGDFDGPEGIGAALAENNDVHVEKFDYSDRATEWVTDGIGEDLAEHILCLGRSSDEAGGPGRVAVVGHSMGGLAARLASSFDGVAERLALVITLGTPHEGSYWAGPSAGAARRVLETIFEVACEGGRTRDPHSVQAAIGCWVRDRANTSGGRALARGSDQLRALAPFPADLPVLAVAGDIQLRRRLLFYDLEPAHYGDLVVSIESATARHQHPDRGGGTHVIDCGPFTLVQMITSPDSDCSHGRLADGPAAARRVADAVASAAEERVADALPFTSCSEPFAAAFSAASQAGHIQGAVADVFDGALVTAQLADGSVIMRDQDHRSWLLGGGVFRPLEYDERLALSAGATALVGLLHPDDLGFGCQDRADDGDSLLFHEAGIGSHPLESDAADLVAGLERTWGPPEQDSGWAPEPCTEGLGVDSYDRRELRWGGIAIHLFKNGDGPSRLEGWSYQAGREMPRDATIAFGLDGPTTWSDVEALGGSWDSFYHYWEFDAPSGQGTVAGEFTDPDDPPNRDAQVSLVDVGWVAYLAGC